MVAVKEEELVGEGQGPLQPDGRAPTMLGKRVQRVESSLHPRGGAPERLRNETMGQRGHGRQPATKGRRQEARRDWKGGTTLWQVEYARVQRGS